MKINILTFHEELNYGANLQAYALRQYLTSLGHEVFFIGYRRSSQQYSIVNFIKRWVGKTFKSTFEKYTERRNQNLHRRKVLPVFKQFQCNYVPTTSVIYRSPKSIKANPPDADCYIVGSDQVWSSKIIDNKDLPVYMLDFGDPGIKRIAYAVSSGGELIPEVFQTKAIECLSRFDAVGAREESLVSHLSELGVVGAKWVPDPTILLDWDTYINFDTISRDARIGVFILNKANYSKITFEGACCNEKVFANCSLYRNIAVENNAPIEWIKSIASVRLLITDSYHAVLFAIYTKTPFIFLRWGSLLNRDARIASFLGRIGLESQSVNAVDISIPDFDKSFVDKWDVIGARIEDMQREAKEFVRMHIEN